MPRLANFNNGDEPRVKKPGDGRNWSFSGRTRPALESTIRHAAPEIVTARYDAEKPNYPAGTEPEEQAWAGEEASGSASQEAGRETALTALDEIQRPDGGIDFTRLFEMAQIPHVPVTAEQATQVLGSIPAELPLRVKRLAVKTSLDALSNFDPAKAASSSAHIVGDAAQKMLHVARLVKTLSVQIEAERSHTQAEIEMLEAEVAAKRQMLNDSELRTHQAQQVCRQFLNQLNDVILFFDHEEVSGVEPATITTSAGSYDRAEDGQGDELPAYLREETAMKLLGISTSDEFQEAADLRSGRGRRG